MNTEQEPITGGSRHTSRGSDSAPRNGSRRRKRGGHRFGDEDFSLSTMDEYEDSDWNEFFRACCVRSPSEWKTATVGLIAIAFLVYFFLFSITLFAQGAKVVNSCRVGTYFSQDAQLNPVTGVMVGILSSALVQSSSAITAIIVVLVGNGAITVEHATYLVMGANIGTTITNDIVAAGSIRNAYHLERAFSGAVIHDLVNILSVMILLPFEAATGYLEKITQLIVDGAETKRGEEFVGPIEVLVKPLVDLIIQTNNAGIQAVATGHTCESFYPSECDETGVCTAGFVKCSGNKIDNCPSFYRQGANLKQDEVAGGICIFLGIIFTYMSLLGLTFVLQHLLTGFTTRIVYKATNVNGYITLAFGAGSTMLLQSSSLTTSLLVPAVAVGAYRLEQVFPFTLGANIGTTLSSIMAALISPGLDPLQVALIHMFFNITVVLIWYPIPHMRRLPIYLAKQLGYCARVFRFFPVIYIAMVYFAMPLFFIALSDLYTGSTGGQLAGAIIITLLLIVGCIGLKVWCKFYGGNVITVKFFEKYLSFGKKNANASTDTNPEESQMFEDEEVANNQEEDDDSSTTAS